VRSELKASIDVSGRIRRRSSIRGTSRALDVNIRQRFTSMRRRLLGSSAKSSSLFRCNRTCSRSLTSDLERGGRCSWRGVAVCQDRGRRALIRIAPDRRRKHQAIPTRIPAVHRILSALHERHRIHLRARAACAVSLQSVWEGFRSEDTRQFGGVPECNASRGFCCLCHPPI
jgi:hypothetical protein